MHRRRETRSPHKYDNDVHLIGLEQFHTLGDIREERYSQ